MTDTTAHARELLEQNRFMVLATADDEGRPWATPVWFAPDGLDRLYWLSWPGSRHSELVEHRAEVAVTVFDSTVVPHEGAAFYATATARMVPDDELDSALQVVNERSVAQGLEPFTPERLRGDARLRLYVAELTELWVLDQDAPVDQRAPVHPTRPDRST